METEEVITLEAQPTEDVQKEDTQFVILWGHDKNKAPVWVSDTTGDDEEPIDPTHEKVLKFKSQEEGERYHELTYPFDQHHFFYEVLPMSTAQAMYEEYLMKNN